MGLLLTNDRLNINVVSGGGYTALTYAVISRRASLANMLLADPPPQELVPPQRIRDGTPHCCSHRPSVKALLANNRTDPNIMCVKNQTALIAAVRTHILNRGDRIAVLELLLADFRTDPNIIDWNGDTALTVAALTDDEDALELLLSDERVDTEHMNYNGDTVLRYNPNRQ